MNRIMSLAGVMFLVAALVSFIALSFGGSAKALPGSDVSSPDPARQAQLRQQVSTWGSESGLRVKGGGHASPSISEKECHWLRLKVRPHSGCPSGMSCGTPGGREV